MAATQTIDREGPNAAELTIGAKRSLKSLGLGGAWLAFDLVRAAWRYEWVLDVWDVVSWMM